MYTLVKDPNRLNDVFVISDSMMKPHLLQKIIDHIKDDPQAAAALRDRPRIGKLDLDALHAYPKGTLGHEFAAHMKANNLDPSAIPTEPAEDERAFVHAHLYETHDVWHAVTGFHTDVAGELGLQAFYFAQIPSRLAGTLLTGGLINMMLWNFDDRERRVEAIARGWTMGRKAKLLLGVRWNELWNEDLGELRARFGVDAVRPDEMFVPKELAVSPDATVQSTAAAA